MRHYRSRFLLLTIACFLIVMLGMGLSGEAQAQQTSPPRWLQPQRLAYGWFSTIAVDNTDTVHVGWHGESRGQPADLFWYTSRTAGEPFNPPNDVIHAAGGGLTIRSAIDVSTDGILYLMYRSNTQHRFAAAPASPLAESALNWVNLYDFGNSAYYLDMIVDSRNTIHAVSSEQNVNYETMDTQGMTTDALRERFPCSSCADLIYRRLEHGETAWSSRVNLSKTLEGSERVDIFEGRSGRLYVSWSEGFDWYVGQGDYKDVRFVFSDDGGHTWSDAVVLSEETERYQRTQLALTELFDDSILAVWRYSSTDLSIYYQISRDDGETWTDPLPLPNINAIDANAAILDRYVLITDLVGTAHLFAVGSHQQTGIGPALFHLEYRQGQWLQPNLLYYDANIDRPEWPDAAVGPRNDLHVTWFVRVGDGVDAADVGTLEIFYAERTASQPDNPVLVAYVPTATPIPPPSPVPMFEPTATPISTLVPINQVANANANRDMYAIETVLGVVFTVGILCVGVIVIFGFRLRS